MATAVINSVTRDLLGRESQACGDIWQGAHTQLREVAGVQIRVNRRVRGDIYRRDVVIALIGGKEPGLVQFRYAPAEGGPEIIDVVERPRKVWLKSRRRKPRLCNLVL